MYKNIFQAIKKKVKSHEGKGNIEFARVFPKWDENSQIDFIDYAILPKDTSIGFHCHSGNEEVYFIFKGHGEMRLQNDIFNVKPGDVIVNTNNSSHSLVNNSDEEIHVFVIQVKYSRDSVNAYKDDSKIATIGLDIGGTNTKVLILEDSEIKEFYQIKTPQINSNDEMIDFIVSCIKKLLKPDKDIRGVGIGISGMVNSEAGCLISSCFMPNINNLNIQQAVSDKINKPVYVDNDSNMAAFGELYLGSAKGCENSITLTLGTGIGAGIILNGKLYHGSTGRAGEIGHFIAKTAGEMCSCGKRGCLNMYVSQVALVNNYIKNGGTYEEGGLELLLSNKSEACKIELAFDEMCDYLAEAIVNLKYLFDCETIIITGGISNASELLIDKLKAKVKNKIIIDLWSDTFIRLGRFNEKSGAVGAAAKALEMYCYDGCTNEKP
ncbi:MAG: ROK family protein [Defluviitaleaceae bacterium]|nr:ROK family protein [Defluviitaleaceae bacterium]